MLYVACYPTPARNARTIYIYTVHAVSPVNIHFIVSRLHILSTPEIDLLDEDQYIYIAVVRLLQCFIKCEQFSP